MKLIVKGKSEKSPFRVTIPQEELIEVLCYAMEKANEEHEEENATSPGGFPTALFTCIFPAKAREEVGWNLMPEPRYEGQEELLEIEKILANPNYKFQPNERQELEEKRLKLLKLEHGKEVLTKSPLSGWDKDKAIAAFNSRLERKQGGGGFSIESRQASWDEAWKVAQGYGMPLDAFVKMKGKRPEAKAQVAKQGMAELQAAGIV